MGPGSIQKLFAAAIVSASVGKFTGRSRSGSRLNVFIGWPQKAMAARRETVLDRRAATVSRSSIEGNNDRRRR